MDTVGLDPEAIEPMGALIAVAFTGALISLIGVVVWTFVGDAAAVFIAIGVLVIVVSPVGYLKFRRLPDD